MEVRQKEKPHKDTNRMILVSNIVATVDLNAPIDEAIYSKLTSYAGASDRIRFISIHPYSDSSIVVNIYRSGNIKVVGATSISSIFSAINEILSLLNSLKSYGEPYSVESLRIVNIVSSYDTGRCIDIEALIKALKEIGAKLYYEADIFPAIDVKSIPGIQCKLSIFKSGIVNILGCVNKKEIIDTIEFIDSFITRYSLNGECQERKDAKRRKGTPIPLDRLDEIL